MQALNRVHWEILNATADDWENLEQIYRMICLDFSSDQYQRASEGAYYWRAAEGAPLLETVADGILNLVQSGLLEGRLEGKPPIDQSDSSFVWRGWFRMSPQGRQIWEASEYAGTV
jgi:hypothetical protein